MQLREIRVDVQSILNPYKLCLGGGGGGEKTSAIEILNHLPPRRWYVLAGMSSDVAMWRGEEEQEQYHSRHCQKCWLLFFWLWRQI